MKADMKWQEETQSIEGSLQDQQKITPGVG
jgi:hypothetical protein